MKDLSLIYAGDRDISVWGLKYLLDRGHLPKALLVSDEKRATHSDTLRSLCHHLDDSTIIAGKEFREIRKRKLLADLEPDYIICIHFPYIIPNEILTIPKYGVINLHPAFLPHNRGWHTPSWAILEDTPIGATLHFMDTGVDTGDIIHQKQFIPSPDDTANSLYKKLKELEFEVFKEAWPAIEVNKYRRTSQKPNAGSTHKRKDLFSPNIQEIQLESYYTGREIIQKLRGLTTNNLSEAAYFVEDGTKYRIQISIHKDQQEE